MKIKTKLFASAVISMVLILILLFSFLVTSSIVEKGEAWHLKVVEIKNTVFDLNILLNDYLLNGEERALSQWEVRYNSGLLLLQEAVRESEESELISDMSVDYSALGELFNEVVENYEYEQRLIEEGLLTDELFLIKELQERKISRLLIIYQSIVFSANILENRTYVDVNFAHELNRKITLLMIVLLFATILLVSIKISRDISKPLLELRNFAIQLGKGNLGTKIEIDSEDEIGDLSRAFNNMSFFLFKKNRDLERFAKVAIGREEKMIELKKQIKKLRSLNGG